MAKIENILKKGDKIILSAEDDFLTSVRGSEKYIFDALMKIFENVTITNGKLSTTEKTDQFLASLDYRIFAAFKSAGYADMVKEFTSTYDLISENTQDLYGALGNGRIYAKDINPIKRIEVSKTIDNLTEQGLYSSFIAPVRQGLYRNIMFGASASDTEQFIRNYVVSTKNSDSKLLQYVGQVSTDSLHQFDGSINQRAKDALSLNAVQYVGSLLKDSRAQCKKWVDLNIIKDSDLEDEIQWALDNGYFGGKKASGMIPGTNPSNFLIQRGGYRCRHRAFAVRFVK